jgi:hypothetical protein
MHRFRSRRNAQRNFPIRSQRNTPDQISEECTRSDLGTMHQIRSQKNAPDQISEECTRSDLREIHQSRSQRKARATSQSHTTSIIINMHHMFGLVAT